MSSRPVTRSPTCSRCRTGSSSSGGSRRSRSSRSAPAPGSPTPPRSSPPAPLRRRESRARRSGTAAHPRRRVGRHTSHRRRRVVPKMARPHRRTTGRARAHGRRPDRGTAPRGAKHTRARLRPRRMGPPGRRAQRVDARAPRRVRCARGAAPPAAEVGELVHRGGDGFADRRRRARACEASSTSRSFSRIA